MLEQEKKAIEQVSKVTKRYGFFSFEIEVMEAYRYFHWDLLDGSHALAPISSHKTRFDADLNQKVGPTLLEVRQRIM
jgi:hypothetical protein